MHPTTPCAVVYKFFFHSFFYTFLQVFYSFFYSFFLQFFFTFFYKAVEWAGDFGAGDLGGLHWHQGVVRRACARGGLAGVAREQNPLKDPPYPIAGSSSGVL